MNSIAVTVVMIECWPEPVELERVGPVMTTLDLRVSETQNKLYTLHL